MHLKVFMDIAASGHRLNNVIDRPLRSDNCFFTLRITCRTQICNYPIRSQFYCPDILQHQVTDLISHDIMVTFT